MTFYELLKNIINKLGLAVRTDVQALSDEQKAQVRENIGAVSENTSINGQALSSDVTLTADDVGVYVQSEEPVDAVEGDIWVDVDAESHLDPEIVIDSTLTQSGQAADAKVVGDRIAELESELGVYVTPEMFGAIGDGATDNRAKLQSMFDYAIANNKNVYIPTGVYAFSGQIIFPANQAGMIITGEGKNKAVFKALTNDSQFYFTDFLRYEISQLKFIGTGAESKPLIEIAATVHLSSIKDCVINSNMGVSLSGSAYLKITDTSFIKINGMICNYLLKVVWGEHLYVTNCYFEGLSNTTEDKAIYIKSLVNSHFDKCDICNFKSGIGLLLENIGGNIYNISINKTSFVRNNISIKMICDNEISNIGLNECDTFVDTETSNIIAIERSSSGYGLVKGLHGNIAIRGTLDDNPLLFKGYYCYSADLLKVTNYTDGVYSYSFTFPIKPVVSVLNMVVVNTTTNTATVTISYEKSPFKEWNLPTLKWGVNNGAKPINAELVNTFGEALKVKFTYADSVVNPYSEISVRLD